MLTFPDEVIYTHEAVGESIKIRRRFCVIKIKSVEVLVYRYPLKTIVQTSFGTMHDRPLVLVKLIDEDDYVGVGEVWCNFPAVGAEHRARLIDSVFTPLLLSHVDSFLELIPILGHLSLVHADLVLA